MKDDTNLLWWLQDWYQQRCDGAWEQECGISIETLDNPGWSLTVDLRGTPLENYTIETVTHEGSEDDWLRCQIEDGQFKGYGGPQNLPHLLQVFKKIAETATVHRAPS